MSNVPPYYTVDDETSALLEALLNIVGGVADLQMDDDAREDLYAMGDDLATRFGVASVRVTSEESTDEAGKDITILRYEDHKPKPTLTLVPTDPTPANDN